MKGIKNNEIKLPLEIYFEGVMDNLIGITMK